MSRPVLSGVLVAVLMAGPAVQAAPCLRCAPTGLCACSQHPEVSQAAQPDSAGTQAPCCCANEESGLSLAPQRTPEATRSTATHAHRMCNCAAVPRAPQPAAVVPGGGPIIRHDATPFIQGTGLSLASPEASCATPLPPRRPARLSSPLYVAHCALLC